MVTHATVSGGCLIGGGNCRCAVAMVIQGHHQTCDGSLKPSFISVVATRRTLRAHASQMQKISECGKWLEPRTTENQISTTPLATGKGCPFNMLTK